MNLIDRYVYAVTKELPSDQRKDIEKELYTLIEDMLSERQASTTSEKDVEAVLHDLGDPKLLADKYRDKKRYLIGPENYDKYTYILKIVLKATVLGITIATFIGLAVEPVNAAEAIARLIANVIGAGFSAFAWVTGIFAVLEVKGVNINESMEKEKGDWKPKDLPEIPEKSAIIKPADAIAGIIFSILTIILFNYSPEFLGAYIFDGERQLLSIIPIFNVQFIRESILIFNIVFCLGILRDFIKLWFGKYTINLAVITTILNVAGLALSLILLTNPNLWNADFLNVYGNIPDLNLPFMGGTLNFFTFFTKFFTVVFVFAFTLDTGVTIFRALKYRR